MNYEELKNLVNHHNHLYYDKSQPEISDQQYDKLYDLLEKTEAAQGWAAPDSPTLKVGGSPGKIQHEYKLYSLRKVYVFDDIDTSKFDVITPKIDGANLTLTYMDNRLYLALTRGNGEIGEDVTHLAKYISNLPKLPLPVDYNDYGKYVITGECVTDKEVENYRNYVSGALGLKDPEEFRTREIKFVAHDLLGVELDYKSRMLLLSKMGFTTVMDEVALTYPQDGTVYRINSYKECQFLGYTSKYPRFAIALKPRGELTAISTLQDVLWVVGRTGTVNPVGIIDPVEIDGATISRVTLHNIGIIEQHELGLGDSIEIERAGGVIPKFNRVISHAAHNSKIDVSHAERTIGNSVKRVGPKLYCTSGSQLSTVKLLEYFIKTLGIKGLGPASISKLGLNHPADLYQTQPWHILGANGAKVQEEIERSKTKPYSLVLAALGIPGVGESTAKKITQQLTLFSRLRDVEHVQIPGVGPKTIEQILAWLDENEDWVTKLPLKQSQDMSIEDVDDTDTPHKKVCITGKLDMTKGDMAEHLLKFGFEVIPSVTKDCYALITDGASESLKTQKAQKYGIKIIDYWTNKKEILNGRI